MKKRGVYSGLSLILIILAFIPACSPATPSLPIYSGQILADVTFNVTIFPADGSGKAVYLDILDEVTGLALNPIRYPMTRVDDTHYSLRLPFTPGSVVKYRYSHEAVPPALEYTPSRQQVRYRLFYVTNPAVVEDIVSGWSDNLPDHSKTGQIQGMVFDANHNALSDILITVGGMQTISTVDGSFTLEGLSPGIHNLVAYSMDGAYLPFQQGARIENGAVTSVVARMEPAIYSNITFLVKPPSASLPQGAVLHLLGNITSLGNTFADQEGGMNTVIERALPLSPLPDGTYTASLKLPAGLDLRYKYTLGDGFWNAEHTPGGAFNIRQLIVPGQDALVQDTIDTWGIGNDSAPITFHVNTPANTPAEDIISIQMNPYGWTAPLPMWKTGNNEWSFTLYSPQQILGEIPYRYCRNRVCGTLDVEKHSFTSKSEPQTYSDIVNAWELWQLSTDSTRLEISPVTPREQIFFAGIELDDLYHPAWSANMDTAFNNIHDLGANRVVLRPAWSLNNPATPSLDLVTAGNPLAADENRMIQLAVEKGLNPVLFPTLQSSSGILKWWEATPRDEAWWDRWFVRYRTFILNQAALAEKNGVKALVIGDPAIVSALYNIQLSDGSSSNPPPDYKIRWQNLVVEIRNQYHGALIGVLVYPLYLNSMPPYAEMVDQFYVLYSPKLKENLDSISLEKEITGGLNQNVRPIFDQYSKPVILGISYPSRISSYQGCEDFFQECWSQDPALMPETQILEGLAAQQNIYQAFLNSINRLDWISGVVARGYYPPAALHDSTTSIHGKPAASVVWYWFTHVLGQ